MNIKKINTSDDTLCARSSCHTNGSINGFQSYVDLTDAIIKVDVLPTDVSCFPFMTTLSINILKPSNEFFYYEFSAVTTVTLNCPEIQDLTQKLPPYEYL
ncbi:hypothetical protein DICPUDRAFT_154636 [Dictyostelium purpureum]|uniref:EGF-like domain-containing protein n=1 Tax=Dictyostelium purpureum TaxID=5786 RepID=F0ZRV2_DICPU|nr:uncharacterized protein DICPUDRAFT_154636 [Dictyostelium purpureum]EGC33325.1 hypothetical protein DICPUDRAFT_154636 [Dictyostelium purpureum]|eukprot:XP_003290141.1 hypothetical protein DICPUDRAFT_154636 [Dictyostelium purpureum]